MDLHSVIFNNIDFEHLNTLRNVDPNKGKI